MLGQSVSHYNILEKLGEGGMGVVYKAEDTKLHRPVAIKFLPERLSAQSDERDRFFQEAQAASALNHPNICTIYEIDEIKGKTFIVMEHVEGTTLREWIKRNRTSGSAPRRSSIQESLGIAIQIAEGLDKAHEKGIIHRDIKADNIMVTPDGRAKIMDFGLAKLQGVGRLTKVGSTVGTLAYMSPEQVEAVEVDHRADIFSFGVLLYETLAGRLPFEAVHDAALMYEILNTDPKPLVETNKQVDSELDRLVMKCLEKKREERYQSMREVVVDLKHHKRDSEGRHPERVSVSGGGIAKKQSARLLWVGAAVIVIGLAVVLLWFLPSRQRTPSLDATSIRKMAVLPFKSLRPDSETDFLGFSLTDQVITKLNYIKSVVVRPSDAVRKYEKATFELSQVAKELDVEVILTGSYLKSGDRFRLTAQLVDVPKNQVLWSEPVEVQYADLFLLQDAISQKIIEGLKLHLSTEEQHRLKAGVSSNPVAYEYFLKATGISSRTSAEQALRIKLMDQSIQLDSTYAPAWVARANWYVTFGQEVGNAGRYFEHAEQDVKRALEIDPDNIAAISRLASLYAETGRINEAIPLLQKGLSVSPNDPTFQSRLAYIFRYAGMLDESIKAYQKSALFDSSVSNLLGQQNQITKAYIYKGDYRSAILSARTVQNALESSQLPAVPQYLFYMGLPSYFQKDYPTAFRYFDSCAVADPANSWTLFGQGYKAAVARNRSRVAEVIRKLEERKIVDVEMFYRFTHLYLFVDDTEKALKSMKVAVKGGFICYPYLASDPLTEKLRYRREFQDMLQEARTRHEEFKEKFSMSL